MQAAQTKHHNHSGPHNHSHDDEGFGPLPFQDYARAERERMRAREIVSLVMQVPGWALGALIRRVHTEIRRDARRLILEPNKDSDLKVERYVFGVETMIEALGKAQDKLYGSNSPDVNFRPQRVTMNIEHPGMVLITDARVANVSFMVGGLTDAWIWNPHATGQALDLPTLSPANKASFDGRYTGRIPAGMQDLAGQKYQLIMSFTGPASIVA